MQTTIPFSTGGGPSGRFGWRNLPGGYAPVTYYPDNESVVHISGVAQSYEYGIQPEHIPNRCGIEPIFVLAAGYRPASAEIFSVDSGNAHGRVDVMGDGRVLCVSGVGDQYVSLSGITFRAGG